MASANRQLPNTQPCWVPAAHVMPTAPSPTRYHIVLGPEYSSRTNGTSPPRSERPSSTRKNAARLTRWKASRRSTVTSTLPSPMGELMKAWAARAAVSTPPGVPTPSCTGSR